MAQAPFRTAAITATGDITFGTLGQLTITASNGNLSTTGTLGAGAATVTSLNASSGGITNAGAISGASSIDGSGDLTMGTITMTGFSVAADGVMAALTGSSVGTLTLADGSITDSSGSISFGSDNLDTTGTLDAGAATVTSLDAGSGAIQTTGAISGNTLSTANFTIPSADGSSGQVLKTNGSGTLTWQDDSATVAPGSAAGDVLISDGSGGASFDSNFNYDTSTDTLSVGAGGYDLNAEGALTANSASIASSATATVDTFSPSTYASVKWVISAKEATTNDVHTTEILATNNGTTSYWVPYADVFSTGPLFTVAVQNSGDLDVTSTAVNTLSVKVVRQSCAV